MTGSPLRYLTILLVAWLWANATAVAQDPHFSQFYYNPWHLNPAATGLLSGSWRAALSYRDQWGTLGAPFRTISASADARLPVGRNDYLGAGIGVLHDQAGASRYVQTNMRLGGAYLRKLSGRRAKSGHFLGAGLQAGFGQHQVDPGSIWFSNQFDPLTARPDPGAASGEPQDILGGKLWPDLHAGLLWYSLFPSGAYIAAGGAMHHINQPGITLLADAQETLYRRVTIHASAQIPLGRDLDVQPGLQAIVQGPSSALTGGANLRIGQSAFRDFSLRTGAFMRMSNRLEQRQGPESVIITGALEWERVIIGLSYDITVSPLAQANNGRGAFEIALQYIHPGRTRRGRVECPSL